MNFPISRLAKFALFLLLALGWRTEARSQSIIPDRTPPPESHIHDPGRVLDRSPAIRDKITTDLRTLREKYGYGIYLHVESVFLSDTPQSAAEKDRQRWQVGDDGLIVAYEADTRRMGFGQDISRALPMEPNPISVPVHEAATIINRAISGTRKSTSSAEHLAALMAGLADGYARYFDQRADSSRTARTSRQLLLWAGVLCLPILTLLFFLMNRGRYSPSTDRMEFPDLTASERLGAPCGAEVVSRPHRNS